MRFPIEPSKFKNNIFNWEWYNRDYFISPDGEMEFPNHHCKITWVDSLPYIQKFRNAIDIGCRDGEYTRYLHKHFEHTYCFDYRLRKRFSMNVDLSKVTHFYCPLGDKTETIKASGAGSITAGKIPRENYFDVQQYKLDDFNLKNIDYIKIDVDGYEVKVLEGSMNTIRENYPLLVIEQENGKTDAIEFCLENFNYKIACWDKTNRNVIMRKVL